MGNNEMIWVCEHIIFSKRKTPQRTTDRQMCWVQVERAKLSAKLSACHNQEENTSRDLGIYTLNSSNKQFK